MYQPKLRTRKTKKKLQAKYHGPYTVVRFTHPSAVILKNLASGRTLTKAINISRLKVGYVRANVNAWDPLEVDSEEEPLEEDDLPPSSFGDTDLPDQPDLPSNHTTSSPSTTPATNTYESQVNNKVTPPTPPTTRAKARASKIPVRSPPKKPTNSKILPPSKIPKPISKIKSLSLKLLKT